jgi:3-deoxy-7-phosphoheptulonate synthase
MAQAAVIAGADGLIIEVHPNPEAALSDGFQSLRPDKFRILLERLKLLAPILRRRVLEEAPTPVA